MGELYHVDYILANLRERKGSSLADMHTLKALSFSTVTKGLEAIFLN